MVANQEGKKALAALSLPGGESTSKNHGDSHRLASFAHTLQETLKGRTWSFPASAGSPAPAGEGRGRPLPGSLWSPRPAGCQQQRLVRAQVTPLHVLEPGHAWACGHRRLWGPRMHAPQYRLVAPLRWRGWGRGTVRDPVPLDSASWARPPPRAARRFARALLVEERRSAAISRKWGFCPWRGADAVERPGAPGRAGSPSRLLRQLSGVR